MDLKGAEGRWPRVVPPVIGIDPQLTVLRPALRPIRCNHALELKCVQVGDHGRLGVIRGGSDLAVPQAMEAAMSSVEGVSVVIEVGPVDPPQIDDDTLVLVQDLTGFDIGRSIRFVGPVQRDLQLQAARPDALLPNGRGVKARSKRDPRGRRTEVPPVLVIHPSRSRRSETSASSSSSGSTSETLKRAGSTWSVGRTASRKNI